MLAHLLYLTL